MLALICCVIAAFSYAPPALADNPAPVTDFLISAAARDPWRLDWMERNDAPAISAHQLNIGQTFAQSSAAQPLQPAAIEHSSGYQTFADDKSTHRNIAVASISAGTAGYLVMFLANHH